jgi:hypothetical protein
VRNLTNSSKARSGPPEMKAESTLPRSVPPTLKAWTVPRGLYFDP